MARPLSLNKPPGSRDIQTQTAMIYRETAADLAQLQLIDQRRIIAGEMPGPLPNYADIIERCVRGELRRLELLAETVSLENVTAGDAA
jgi:hypothetical protein